MVRSSDPFEEEESGGSGAKTKTDTIFVGIKGGETKERGLMEWVEMGRGKSIQLEGMGVWDKRGSPFKFREEKACKKSNTLGERKKVIPW
jgi:hypothetical protein